MKYKMRRIHLIFHSFSRKLVQLLISLTSLYNYINNLCTITISSRRGETFDNHYPVDERAFINFYGEYKPENK